MKDIVQKFVGDFLSALVFLVIYLVTGSVVIGTVIGIAVAVAQIVRARLTGKTLDVMTWASLALVVVLGGATLLTNDPRFVMMKPSIAHFAIGAVMLRRGWMTRYMPPIVMETAPELPMIAGYCWAALMFALGAGNIAVASTGDMKLWGFYVTVVAVGAKLAAFGLQYVTFRLIIGRRIARQRSLAAASQSLALQEAKP